jgi:hypothetical protein
MRAVALEQHAARTAHEVGERQGISFQFRSFPSAARRLLSS